MLLLACSFVRRAAGLHVAPCQYSPVSRVAPRHVISVILGLAYPRLDRWLNSTPAPGRDWASVIRCLALFVGINHANSRFHFATDTELAWTLALLSLALWWTFDRTTCGFVIASLAAAVAHVVAYYLVMRLVFR